MKVLNVSDCDISCKGAELLARALSVNSSLEELYIMKNSIGDKGVAHIADFLQRNTTMKVLNVEHCGISCKGAESLARALSVNSLLEQLYIMKNSIGDEGVTHIAKGLQTNTMTMKVLNVEHCGISCRGAESLARVLVTTSSSLENLLISGNKFGDDGIAHIATALQTNNTLKSLSFLSDSTATDKAALSLATTLTTNTSLEKMSIGWMSAHPDTTLKKMSGCIKKSTLRELKLEIVTPQPLCKPQVSLEEKREWYQCVEVGGKELILSLEDSRLLESFWLTHGNLHSSMYTFESSTFDLRIQIDMSLEGVARSVNFTRKMNYLPEVQFYIRDR